MINTAGIKIVAGLLAAAAISFAAGTPTYAHGSHGGGGSGGGIVPVHGSPSMSGGILVTHGNLKFTPPPSNIVRDHRTGYGYRGGWYCWHNPGACWSGGVSGGTPSSNPTLPDTRGATVRDHRH
jgi:hypothetical protein